METKNTIILEWQAAARPDYERSEKWYVGAGTFCIVMIAYGILSGAWGLSIIFALLPALYYMLRNQGHKKHRIRIREMGIEIDDVIRGWGELKEFWILEGPGYYELHIAPMKKMKSDIVVLTGTVDPFVLRDALSAYLPQIAHQKERLLDAIIRFCKL